MTEKKPGWKCIYCWTFDSWYYCACRRSCVIFIFHIKSTDAEQSAVVASLAHARLWGLMRPSSL